MRSRSRDTLVLGRKGWVRLFVFREQAVQVCCTPCQIGLASACGASATKGLLRWVMGTTATVTDSDELVLGVVAADVSRLPAALGAGAAKGSAKGSGGTPAVATVGTCSRRPPSPRFSMSFATVFASSYHRYSPVRSRVGCASASTRPPLRRRRRHLSLTAGYQAAKTKQRTTESTAPARYVCVSTGVSPAALGCGKSAMLGVTVGVGRRPGGGAGAVGARFVTAAASVVPATATVEDIIATMTMGVTSASARRMPLKREVDEQAVDRGFLHQCR